MKPAIKDFGWVAGPKVLAGAFQFALMLVLIRCLAPNQFGIISVCMAAVLLGDAIIGGATDSGVLRLAPLHSGNSPERSLQYQQAGVLFKLILVSLLAVPVLLLQTRISSVLFQDSSKGVFLTISLAALLGLLVLRSAQMCFQVNSRFVPYGVSDMLSSALKFGGIALLLLARPGPGEVLLLYALAPATVAAVVLSTAGKTIVTVPFSHSAMAELVGFVKWYLATCSPPECFSSSFSIAVSSDGEPTCSSSTPDCGRTHSDACRCWQTPTLTAEPRLASAAFAPLPAVLCSSLHFSTTLRLSNRCVAQTLTM